MSLYRVIGKASYRNHAPGELFEAKLDYQTELRAIRRGNILLVKKSHPALVDGSWRLPTREGKIWFVVPVHGREELTRVCLRQLARTCDAVAATAVIIGEGEVLDYAHDTLGFATVRRSNRYLGAKFNDGFELACSDRYNPRRADFVVPCGSDDMVDPVVFDKLPSDGTIGVFHRLAVVDETRTRVTPIRYVGMAGGIGIRIIPRDLIAKADYRPADEDRPRAIDASTFMGICRAIGGRKPGMRNLDRHAYQIVDWKSSGEQLNTYKAVVGHGRRVSYDPLEVLADLFPEALDEMRALIPEAAVA